MLSRCTYILVCCAMGSVVIAAPSAIEQTVQTYVAAWQTADEMQRNQLIDKVWDKSGEYTDPTVQFKGAKALSQHIGKLLQQFPGARTEVVGQIDSHHQRLRFRWKILAANGEMIAEGMDFGELAADGRLRRITGFF